MKCKKCGAGNVKYLNRASQQYSSGVRDRAKRTKMVTVDNIAKCSKCNWSGKYD